MHLLTDGSILLDVVERPTASKVSQGSEHQQLYRRCLFVVPFMTTPSVKQFAFGDRRYQMQEIGIWKTNPLAEGGGRRVHHLEDESFGVKEQRKGSI